VFYHLSTPILLKKLREVFPFGVFSLVFVSISLFGTLLLKHPANEPNVVALADYLLIMGTLALIFAVALTFSPRPPNTVKFNIMALPVSFLLGLGFIAIIKGIGFSTLFIGLQDFFETFMVNPVLTSFSSVGLPTEISMFFVASIEELTFRIAIPAIIMIAIPLNIGVEARWGVAVFGSSLLFGMWHIFAYGGDTTLMVTAMVSGGLLSVAYRIGEKIGGHDLAFLGIVGGHYYWNLVASNIANSFVYMIVFMVIVILFAMTVSSESQRSTAKYVSGIIRGIQR